ncbi:MAG: hypothetical protein FJ302_18255 [Planctomycetes bacterium]|nr:hypothetical protein [Planctomycetota bacterium]
MRRWSPIIFAVVAVLLFRLPEILLRRNVDQKLREIIPPKKDSLDTNSKTKPAQRPVTSNSASRYEDKENGFSIEFPPDWTIKHALSNEPIAIKAVRYGSDNRFAAINIYVQEADDIAVFWRMTPKEWFEDSFGDEATLIASGREKIGPSDAMWFEMHAPKQNGAYSVAYGVTSNGKIFLLYGTAVVGGEAWYRENKPHLLRAIRSFRFLRGDGVK